MKIWRPRALTAIAAIVLLASGAGVAITRLWGHVDDRVYVVGWQNSPPFQVRAADGSPAGLAVDLVRDAARRRGIRLRWVWIPAGPDAALRNRQADLWPLVTITPERRTVFHISRPYLQHDHDFLVLARSPYFQIEDLGSASVSYTVMPINRRFLNRLLPHARLVSVTSGEETIENVCAGQTDAAFLDEFNAGAVLLGGGSCSHQALRAIPAPTLRTKLGVGSTFEASVVADEIRRGIDTSILGGDLENILKSGGYLSARNVQYFTALLDAQQHEKWLTTAVAVFIPLLALTIFEADRIRRERNRIKVTEEDLRHSERRFRGMLENVRLVAVMTDVNGTINFWNDYAEAITGWKKEEVIGRRAKEFLNVTSRLQETGGAPGPALREASQAFWEGSVLQKDGGQRLIQWSSTPLYDSAGRIAGLASLGEDVTELWALRAEAARLEGEEQFRKIADTAPMMIWTAGPDMRCTFVNKAWREFTGRAVEEQLGDGWTSNIHRDDFENTLAICAEAWAARRSIQCEFRKRRGDGEYRWVFCSGLPRFAPGGECLGYIGTCTDVTDLKRSRDEDSARQKLESVGRLAGGIAHDFNNLLGGVLAQADLALTEVSAGILPKAELNSIRGVAIRGSGIVRQLMIYAGQESPVCEPVHISLLIEDMLDLLKVVVSKHVVLRTELGRDLPAVEANPARLRQVVLNLVTNASEAIGDVDGMIVIRTARMTNGPDASRSETSEQVMLEISDNGCGIGRDARSTLFDPFFTTKSTGRGLGLSVVQRVVKELGGVIELDSQPGCGATFRILLPSFFAFIAPAGSASVYPTLKESRHAVNVLLVEDEEPLRRATAKMLAARGFGVLEAADGTEAMSVISKHKDCVSVILLDITLPGRSSRDVLAEVRRVRPAIKVIVTSAYSRSRADESFPGLEIDAFLRKPYTFAELVSLVLSLVVTDAEVVQKSNVN